MAKRTYETYYDEKRQIMVIDKPKSEMSAIERYLIKYEKDKYTNKKVPEKIEMTTQERLDYRAKLLEKQEREEEKQLWKDVDKYLKNPKKFENKMSKKEKAIMKFFNERRKKTMKHDKNVKEAKKWAKKGMVYKLAYDKLQEEYEELLEFGELNIYGNPNKSYVKRNTKKKDVPEERSILLEAIEEEILERLNRDDFGLGLDNIVVQHKNSKNKVKKAKKKASDVIKQMTI